jgi:predicted DNA-binding transcriptional regulator YafY
MTPEEAEALFLAGLPGPAAELGLGTVVAAAQLKVLASLPPELRARASRLVERFHLDAGDWFKTSQPVPHLAALSDAVWSSTRIAIDYERGDGTVRRVLDPLGVVLKAGIWYVVARVDEQIRTYRVSRVAATEPLNGVRPPRRLICRVLAESAAARTRRAASKSSFACTDGSNAPRRGRRHRAAGGESPPDPDPEGWRRFPRPITRRGAGARR